MIHVTLRKLQPDQAVRLREWLAEATERGDEVRETLRNEGVTHERAQLVETSDGTLLIYLVECADYEAAQAVFAQSDLPIDVEHKKVMAEVGGEPVDSEVLLDIQP